MNSIQNIDHVVLDIGRVLIHWDKEIPFLELIPDTKKRTWFLENVCSDAWNLEQDRGRPFKQAEEELIRKFPEESDNIRSFRSNWYKMVPHAIEGSFEVMDQLLMNNVDVTLLTNFSHETYPEALELYPGLSKPRGVTVSGAVKLLKPSREIYELHASNFGLDPAKILFFDDSPKNVEGARHAGWNAEIFVSAPQMEAKLRNLGLL